MKGLYIMFEVKSMTAAKGFTKEQQKYIADEIIKEINNNKNISSIVEIIKNQYKNDIKESLKYAHKNNILNLYDEGKKEEKETIKIKLPDCNFKLEIINSICILIDFLTRKMHVNLQIKGQKENKILNELSKINNIPLRKTKDNFITDGNIGINTKYLTNIPESFKFINIDNSINGIIKDLKPLNDYKKEENQKEKTIKNKKFCIFYKNKKDDFIVINQKYFDLIKKITKDFNIFIEKAPIETKIRDKKIKMITDKIIFKNNENEIIAIVMCWRFENLKDFELLPEIIEEEEKEEEKELNKINSELIKAETEETEEETKHINYVTGHEYSGNNIKILDDFMKENNYKEYAWLGAYQAKKTHLQLKKDAKPVNIYIYIYHENEDGKIFKSIESVYNIADFEPLKKIEESEDFIKIVDELKKVG